MEVDYQVIKRYLEGREREGDKEQIIDWFSDIRFEQDIKIKYRLFWDEMSGNIDKEECDKSGILGRIYHKIKIDEYRKPPRDKRVTRIINVISKIAAILFIPLLAYLWVVRENDSSILAEIPCSEVYSPPGIRTMFCLPDGSTGWLNGNSRLEFPLEFRGRSREVLLHGEAYFDVISDAKKPFIVKGEHTDLIAHGTSFNIQDYPEDPEIQITLVSGNIEIFNNQEGMKNRLAKLSPNQMCSFYPANGSHRIETVDTKKITAWTEGKLIFRDENLTEVVKEINRWYNVEIMIKDDVLKSYSYQATFMDETLEEVLKLLQHSAPIEYKNLGRKKRPDGTFEKRKIELRYKPC